MGMRKEIDVSDLSLPEEILNWVKDAKVYDSSGESGAVTVYIDRDGGAYLKIAESGSLSVAAQMQTCFADKKMTSPVIRYLSLDRDCLIIAPQTGEEGFLEKYLSEPERLSVLFGESLRLLHEVDSSDCPVRDKMSELIDVSQWSSFRQTHLDSVSEFIGKANSATAASEIVRNYKTLKNDVVMHGDYCLVNIRFLDWKLAGFIDLGEGGIGDRHYDIVSGLWALNRHLNTQKYGEFFLDAYGRDKIDKDRLYLCGLLMSMEPIKHVL